MYKKKKENQIDYIIKRSCPNIADFEDEEGGDELRDIGSLQKVEKSKQKDSPLEPP